MPFWVLVGEFAGQGLSMAKTAKAIGYSVAAFNKLLLRTGNGELWSREPILPARYFQETGEPFIAACKRLAATTHISEAARQLGFSSGKNLRLAMQARGVDLEFQAYQPPRKPRKPAQWSKIRLDEVDRYLARRAAGEPVALIATAIGRESAALYYAAKRMRPEAIAAISKTAKRRDRHWEA